MPKAKGSAAAGAKGQTLVEQTEPEVKRRRQNNRRALDSVVDRCIQEQFAGWSIVATDVKLVGGLTLRQRIHKDKEEALGTTARLGANYWKELRQTYALDDSIVRKLAVANPDDKVSPALISALESANATNTNQRNKAPLFQYLATATECNQKELVGLLRSILEVKPTAVGSSCPLIIAALKFICRLSLDKKHPSEVAFVKAHMDEALATTYIRLKREGVPLSTFWSIHREFSHPVINVSDVDIILAASGQWTDVASEVAAVCASSSLGKRMFAFASDLLVSENMVLFVDRALWGMPSGKVTSAMVEVIRQQCHAEAKRMHADLDLTERRCVAIKYRGIKVDVPITTLGDEISVRISAFLKTAAAGANLVCLDFEGDLVDSNLLASRWTIDDKLLQDYRAARLACNGILKQEELSNGEALKALMTSKSSTFIGLDRTFILELAFVDAMASDVGEKVMGDRCLECLPKEGVHMSLTESLSALAVLADSRLYSFVSRSAQARTAAVREVLGFMLRGQPPSPERLSATDFMKQVAVRLPYFMKYEPEANGDGCRAPLYGKEALLKKFSMVTEMSESGLNVSFAQLEDFHTFAWLLSPTQKETVASLVKKALAMAPGSAVVNVRARTKKKAAVAQSSSHESLTKSVEAFFA